MCPSGCKRGGLKASETLGCREIGVEFWSYGGEINILKVLLLLFQITQWNVAGVIISSLVMQKCKLNPSVDISNGFE